MTLSPQLVVDYFVVVFHQFFKQTAYNWLVGLEKKQKSSEFILRSKYYHDTKTWQSATPAKQNKTKQQSTSRTIQVINIDAETQNKRSANHIHKFIKRTMVSYKKVQLIPRL